MSSTWISGHGAISGNWVSGGSAEPFSPDLISGLTRWFDFSDLTTITKDGSDLVSQVVDKSSNAVNATQSTAGKKPTYVAASQNGKSILRFSGAQNGPVLDLGTGTLITTATGFSIFIAFKVNTFLTEVQPYLANFKTDASTTYGIMTEQNTGRLHSGGSGLAQLKSDASAFTFTDFGIATIQGVGSDVTSVANYNLLNNANSLNVNSGGLAGGWVHANSYFGMSRYSDGTWYASATYDAGELLIYNGTMSTASRTSIISYLKTKWGIA